MKKYISIVSFVLAVGIFFWLSNYMESLSFNYHVAQFVGYIFYWSVSVFIVNLFAFTLNNEKYKLWIGASFSFICISIFLAYYAGDGRGTIVDFDGKDLTWILAALYTFLSFGYISRQYFKKK